jgi:hypothetical protein
MTNTAGEDDKSHGFLSFENGSWKLSFAFLFKEEDLFSQQSRKGLNTIRLFTLDGIRWQKKSSRKPTTLIGVE